MVILFLMLVVGGTIGMGLTVGLFAAARGKSVPRAMMNYAKRRVTYAIYRKFFK